MRLMTIPVLLQTLLIDPMDVLPRIDVGDRVWWHLELCEPSGLPDEFHVELDATVKRHGRGGGTAVLTASGIEFAMDGDRYPTEGGRLRGTLEEILPYDAPHGLEPVEGVVRRLRALTGNHRRLDIHDVDVVPRGRDVSAFGGDVTLFADLEVRP